MVSEPKLTTGFGLTTILIVSLFEHPLSSVTETNHVPVEFTCKVCELESPLFHK